MSMTESAATGEVGKLPARGTYAGGAYIAKPAMLPSVYTAFPHVPHPRRVLESHASFSSAPAPFAAARVVAAVSNSQYTHERAADGSSARRSSVRSTVPVIR